jgi:hypothetical protein
MERDKKALLQSSYLSQKHAQAKMKHHGYILDSGLSSMDTKVFVKNGKPTVVHRGSTTAKDYVDDALLTVGLGKHGHRYKNAVRVTQKAEHKYGTAANAIGHSYGAWLGEHSGANGDITTYNKAVSLADVFKTMPPNQTDFRTANDLVSMLSQTQGGDKRTINGFYGTPSPLANGFISHGLDMI